MWVVMRLQKFTDFEVATAFRLPEIRINAAPMIGYLPVYASLADAKRDFPEGPFKEIAGVE